MIATAHWQHALKRAFDIVVGSALLVASLPVLAACMLAVRLSSKRGEPVIFRQSRVGRWGRPFVMYKLRTMHDDAAEILSRHLAESPQEQAEWDRFGRLANDPRLTRLGRWLRITSLDELPQLWNVVKGDMSLVGPRPLYPSFVERFQDAMPAGRQSVRPGLTGLWQVSGRSELDVSSQFGLDQRYLDGWSLWRDIVILCRTPAAVLSRRGAY
jgi:undecaprenyl-phosphate galactose phosphotransferase